MANELFRYAVTTACILGSDYTSNCFLANELFRPVRARRVFGVLNFIIQTGRDARPMFFFVALVLKVDDCVSWSGLLSWLDFYCGRSPSPVIEPPMHGFCVSAGLGPSICAAHVWRSQFFYPKRTCEIHVLSEVSMVATPAGKPGFFLHAWRPPLGSFMPVFLHAWRHLF